MRKIITIAIIMLSLAVIRAEKNIAWQEIYKKAMFLTYDDKYDSARSLMSQLKDTFQRELGIAIITFIQAKDLEDSTLAAEALRRIPVKSCKIKEYVPREECDRFLLGTAFIFKGMINGFLYTHDGKIYRVKRFMSCTKSGEKIFTSLKYGEGIEGDIAAMIGNVWYWTSKKAGALRVLGLMRNRKDEGLIKLQEGAAKARIFVDFAKSSAVAALIDDGNIDFAESILKTIKKRHPNSRTAMWHEMAILLKKEKYDSAIVIAEKLLDFYRERSKINCAQLLQIIVEAAEKKGDEERVEKYKTELEWLLKDKYIKSYLKRKSY